LFISLFYDILKKTKGVFMKNYVFMAILSLFLISCGGGSGGDSGGGSNTPTTPTTPDYGLESQVGDIDGVFLDEKVAGLTYTSTSHSGTTDGSGNFTCAAGEDVTFSVNSLVLGTVPCLPVITPIELVTKGKYKWDGVTQSGDKFSELSDAENKKLKRLLMLMQTVDTNGDPSDGISVDANLATALSGMSMTQSQLDSLLTEDSDADFTTALTSLVSAMGGSTAVASSASAISHFQTTLNSQTACTTGDITGSATVSGVTPDCVALSCGGGYTLTDGSCVAKTACNTSHVSNSSSVTGYVEDGCTATACNAGYGLTSGSCVAMTACTTADVANSTAVTGYRDNSTCSATSCDTGYAVSSGSCVVSTASQVVGDAVDFYNSNLATTDFITDIMGGASCSGASTYSTMKTLYADRASNSFLTSGAYLQDRTCLDRMVKDVMLAGTDSSPWGLNRDADVLSVSGASDLTSSFFNVDGTLGNEEIVLLELLFADQ
jgi:hypothetical protein